ncbi:hypothetical protein [Nocardia cyriacigeorgica]|uniref:hypothetical protein n=1 Tax=Nocardia cyriacigeorgica TaxID=135487 RepID=UPI001893A558|nr:hypothetical protein [Nocardia cyriacigeorgica]MBF6285399.1 hypothetical protein [Nocardia cyriacigeorgica]
MRTSAADTEPVVEVYDGNDLAEYVIDCNSSRRHMSTGARAMSTALVLAADGRRGDGRWRRGSVDIGDSSNIDAWRKALNNAGTVLDHAPALAQEVVDGNLALDAAYRKACEARDAERRKLAAMGRGADAVRVAEQGYAGLPEGHRGTSWSLDMLRQAGVESSP